MEAPEEDKTATASASSRQSLATTEKQQSKKDLEDKNST